MNISSLLNKSPCVVNLKSSTLACAKTKPENLSSRHVTLHYISSGRTDGRSQQAAVNWRVWNCNTGYIQTDGKRFKPNKQQYKVVHQDAASETAQNAVKKHGHSNETMLTKGYQLQLNVFRRFEISRRFRITYNWGIIITIIKQTTWYSTAW